MTIPTTSSTSSITTDAPSYVGRVLSHDSTRKGVTAAVAGLLVAAVAEAIWPSND